MLHGHRYNPKMKIVPQIGIASYITNFGHDVTWVLPAEMIKEVQETTFDGVRVFIVPCKSREEFLKPITEIIYLFRRMCFVLRNFKQERYNMLFVRDSLFDGLLAFYLKRRYKIPFVFQMSNPFEQRWEIRRVYRSKHEDLWYFISKIEAYIIMYALRKADLVLSTTKWMLEDFAKKGVEKTKMMPYQNGIDTSRFLDADGEEIRKRYRLEDSKVVIYVGTMRKET